MEYPLGSPNATGFQMVNTKDNQYIITIDKIYNFLTISKLNNSNGTVSITRQQVVVGGGPILAACMNANRKFFYYTEDCTLHVSAAPFTSATYILTDCQLGISCYFDGFTDSVIFMS